MDNKIIETTFLIIGGGIAGVSCAETISYLCPGKSICLVTESNLIKTVTNILPLAKFLTKFDVEEKNESSLTKSINTIIDSLSFINSKNQNILTQSGKTIKYSYLCLCTGGRPKLIVDNSEYIIGIRDTDSVIDFQKRIKESKKIIVLGNGGIATEIVYGAKNILIDWVIKDTHVSSTFLDAGAAEFLKNRLDKNKGIESKAILKRMRYSEDCLSSSLKQLSGAALGPDWHKKFDMSGNNDLTDLVKTVQIHYNTGIKSIEKISANEYPLKVVLTNNEILHCNFLISAIGVYPSLNFTSDESFIIDSDGGINVDEMMKTNLKNIYAAGDVCHANWNYSEHWFQMRLWTQARQMGAMAGKAMAAEFTKEPIYQDFCFELFGHVTELYGKQVVLLGNYNGQGLGTDYEILLRVTSNVEYVKFVIKDGKLKGATLIGETGLEETCENLILNQIDLTPYGDDLLNPDIDIEDYFD